MSPEAGSWPATTESGRSMVARRRAVVERVPRDITDSDPADSIRPRPLSPAPWAGRISLMIGSLESDGRLFKSYFRCTATGRRAFSTTLASVGMYDASVGSTNGT
jgi:hypothetical protein